MTRTEYDGSITVLADRFEGERLDSLDEKQLYLVDRTAEGRRQTMASSHSVYSLYAETRASV